MDQTANRLRREADAARSLIDGIHGLDDETRHDTVEGETDLFEAIDAALAEIDECTATEDGCRSVAETYTKRADKAKARATRIRGLIEQAMLIAEVRTVKRPSATLTVKDTKPKAMVVDEAAIPSEFWVEQPPKLDKSAINAAVSDGRDIPGISLDNGGTSIQIRRL